MSKPYYFEKYYKDVDFTTDEAKSLKSEFLEFGSLWGMSIAFTKRNFKRVFLFPALWQLLMGTVAIGIIVLLSLNTILNSNPETFQRISDQISTSSQYEMMSEKSRMDSDYGFTQSDLNSDLDRREIGDRNLNPSNFNTLENTGNIDAVSELALSFIGVFFLYLLFVIILSVVFSLIYLRQIYIANSKSVEGIWKTPRGFYLVLLKLIGISIIYGIGSSIVSAIFSAISEPLGSLVSIIIQIGAYGLFGLCTYLLVVEKEGFMGSLQLSYKLMKPIFWKNVGRWALLLLVMIGIGLGIGIVFVIVGFILFFIGMSLKGAALGGFIALSVLIFVALLFGVSLIVNSLTFAFNYLSFVNIRMYRGNVMLESREEEEKENAESESKAETKVEQIESSEVKVENTVVEDVAHTKKTHKEPKIEEEK
jgi:hypothetical protein